MQSLYGKIHGGIEMNENLCMAVGCLTIADKICKCRVNVDGKDRIETIRFCKDHFLRQKALDYHKEESK